LSSRYEKSRYDDDELDDFRDEGGREREISLGTATILGIFFALALLCALFFGFGYSMGRKSAQPSPVAAVDTPAQALSGGGGSKPAPGQSPAQKQSGGRPADAGDAPAAADKVVVREADSTPHAAGAKPVAQPVAASAAVVATPATVAAGTPGSALVQVAAVSHQEDADLLVGALKRKGYSVTVRQTPQDKLLHVQIGPFASKKDAVAMQQRLQADGYNAIVK